MQTGTFPGIPSSGGNSHPIQHNPLSNIDDAVEKAVNGLKGIKLDRVELTPEFRARIQWEDLPPGFMIRFLTPVVVKYLDNHVVTAKLSDKISSDDEKLLVPLSLPDEQESFQAFALDVLKLDHITLGLEGKFCLWPGPSRAVDLDQKISFRGMNSLSGAITLEQVEIRKRVPGGLLASVEAKIKNITNIDVPNVALLAADIFYRSTKVGHHQDQTFKFMSGNNEDKFHWIFTPPLDSSGVGEFQYFISQFLTTKVDIPISLDLKRIQIKIGDYPVVLNGTVVHTTIKGLGQSLISRVDVYLGFKVLRREVSFRFRLVNPIHASIEVLDVVVDSKVKGRLLSHLEHTLNLTIPTFQGEKESEVITAKLKNDLLRTIWLVRARTKINLQLHIISTTISIDGYPVPNLELKLEGVPCRIHFGRP